jgi:hypothetical protein
MPGPPPPRGASFCLPRNISGVSASVNNTYYVLYPSAATYDSAVSTCYNANGRLAYWLNFETQIAVEQVGRRAGRRARVSVHAPWAAAAPGHADPQLTRTRPAPPGPARRSCSTAPAAPT